MWELSVPSPQFLCKSKTVLKIKSIKKKKDTDPGIKKCCHLVLISSRPGNGGG